MWDSRAEAEAGSPGVTTAGPVIAQNAELAHGVAWVIAPTAGPNGWDAICCWQFAGAAVVLVWTARSRDRSLGRRVNLGPQRVIPSLPEGTSVQLPQGRPPQGAPARFLVDDNRLFRHSHSQPPPAAAHASKRGGPMRPLTVGTSLVAGIFALGCTDEPPTAPAAGRPRIEISD